MKYLMLRGPLRLRESFFYYWSDNYETSDAYVELNFRNILFVTIFRFSA